MLVESHDGARFPGGGFSRRAAQRVPLVGFELLAKGGECPVVGYERQIRIIAGTCLPKGCLESFTTFIYGCFFSLSIRFSRDIFRYFIVIGFSFGVGILFLQLCKGVLTVVIKKMCPILKTMYMLTTLINYVCY